MAQNPTQRVTGSSRTRGPQVITLRGAGSKGNDYKFGGVAATGIGLDVGESIQVPVGQVAPVYQIEQPDTGNATGNPPVAGAATINFRQFANGAEQISLTPITASGAVPVAAANYVITAAGVATLTLAAPAAGAQDGIAIWLVSATNYAHTLTSTGNMATGAAANNVATWAAHAGASLLLIAYNGVWTVMAQIGISFS